MMSNVTFLNMRNCHVLIALKISSVLANTITVANRDFDFDFQRLNYKYGTSAFYVQDSRYMGMDSHYSNIFSPNQGASVIHVKSYNVGEVKYDHEIQIDKDIYENNTGAGSALVFEDTNTTIVKSRFINNTNYRSGGGAIAFLCTQKNYQSKYIDSSDIVYRLPLRIV